MPATPTLAEEEASQRAPEGVLFRTAQTLSRESWHYAQTVCSGIGIVALSKKRPLQAGRLGIHHSVVHLKGCAAIRLQLMQHRL